MNTLNTENPNCFAYQADELLIELLGGVRIDTLDRMRVTIKVTVVNRKHKEYMNNEELAGFPSPHSVLSAKNQQDCSPQMSPNGDFAVGVLHNWFNGINVIGFCD